MSTTRFPFGVTNVAKTSTLGLMGQLDPTKFHTYFNDFDTYTSGNFTETVTGTGTVALSAADGGELLLTNSAALSDAIYSQLVNASFLMAANKKAFFKAKFQVSDATNATFQLGLIVTDTTPLTATDGIYFQKDSGVATIDAYVRKDTTTGSNSKAAVATIVSATDTTVGWYYDGSDTVYFYVNDILVATLGASSTYLPDALLSVSFGVENGTAAADTLSLDYILAAKER